jgi:hypothetical protein
MTVLQCSPAFSSEVQHVNPIDRSVGVVFARWQRLGILALARLVGKRHRQSTYSRGGCKSRSSRQDSIIGENK